MGMGVLRELGGIALDGMAGNDVEPPFMPNRAGPEKWEMLDDRRSARLVQFSASSRKREATWPIVVPKARKKGGRRPAPSVCEAFDIMPGGRSLRWIPARGFGWATEAPRMRRSSARMTG